MDGLEDILRHPPMIEVSREVVSTIGKPPPDVIRTDIDYVSWGKQIREILLVVGRR